MNAFMLFAKKYRVEYTQMYPGKDNRYAKLYEIQGSYSHHQGSWTDGFLYHCVIFKDMVTFAFRAVNCPALRPETGFALMWVINKY